MSGKIDVLGVKIDNVTAQEAMEAAKEFLKTDTLSSVGTINGSVLLEAGQDEEYRHKIENLDLCVVTDRAVLDAAGITAVSYTHLDVYKRQVQASIITGRSLQMTGSIFWIRARHPMRTFSSCWC